MSVTACSSSLNAKTLNVKSVSAMYDKCVLIDKHAMCVLKSVAKPLKKTAVSESTKKPRNLTRKLHECVSKTCSWWYSKFTPSGYIWKPKSGKEEVNPNVSMPLGNVSITANVKDTMTSRRSIVSNTLLSSNSFAAHRDYSIHRRLWKLQVEEHRRNVMLPKNKTSVTAFNDSLNAKTVHVKSVSAICAKCVLIDKHDLCVPKSVAKPLRKTVASESNKKPRNNVRKLHERFGKIYKWSYIKFTPLGYIWKPKSNQENVNPNPSLNGRGGPIAPIAIQAMNFGLKNDMIQRVHNSFQFHGLLGDDANKHLDKFLHVTQRIKVNGVTDDALRLYLFSHSLTHHATTWFDRLLRNSINTFSKWPKCFSVNIFHLPWLTDYDEVFAPAVRIEAIRLFLAYASFKDFIVYQMDVKSSFLYGKIEKEVYVCQPPRFEDLNFFDKVYKVEKVLCGLHQALRAWLKKAKKRTKSDQNRTKMGSVAKPGKVRSSYSR
nr:retrovirus-related Pol polyprotein from transposon TNT 1-94 [Tanacetum cinerariifolium]